MSDIIWEIEGNHFIKINCSERIDLFIAFQKSIYNLKTVELYRPRRHVTH